MFNAPPPFCPPRRSFRCRSTRLPDSFVRMARWWCSWLSNYRCWGYSPAGVKVIGDSCAAPDNHFAAGPHRRVCGSSGGCVGSAGGRPVVSGRSISSAGVKNVGVAILSSPDNHFAASPDCRMIASCGGRVGGASGCQVSSVHPFEPFDISGLEKTRHNVGIPIPRRHTKIA